MDCELGVVLSEWKKAGKNLEVVYSDVLFTWVNIDRLFILSAIPVYFVANF